MGLTLVAVVLGAIVAIGITILLEVLRKPKLELRIAPPVDAQYQGRPATRARFLYLELINKPLPVLARWMTRNGALQCHGTVAFHHLDGQSVFGRVMPIRWSGLPEPVPLHFVVDDKHVLLLDPLKLTLTQRVDVYPGEAERLDVAARFDNEPECYGWSNESYFSDPIWRNPNWRLPSDRYLVKVTIISAGEKCRGIFRLINDVVQQDFRVEPALSSDSVRD
jgi:hypothetical protein